MELMERIYQCLPYCGDDPENDRLNVIDLQHGWEAAQHWRIQPGWRMLEAGCWDGYMSLLLAEAVGEQGHVTAVDILPAETLSDPGNPTSSLGQAAEFVNKSWLGDRIEYRFETDLLNPTIDFPENHFDLVVFHISSFYMWSPDILRNLFKRVRPWARRLGYREWDLRPHSLNQVPHLLALLLKAHLKTVAPGDSYLMNAWSLILPAEARRMAEEAGWEIITQDQITSGESLRDGIDWEPPFAVWLAEKYLADAQAIPDEHTRHLIDVQAKLLKHLNETIEKKTLFSHIFLAE